MKKSAILVSVIILAGCSTGNTPIIGISSSISGGKLSVNDTYGISVAKAGGVPLILPAAGSAEEAELFISAVDALVLTGGEDVDPARYGEQPVNGSVKVNAVRDSSDFRLVEAALKAGKPMLCICRGEQLANVALGGSLWQDIPSQNGSGIAHRQDTTSTVATHWIYIDRGSRLHELLGRDSVMVNSFHHEAVKIAGKGVKVSAVAPDGIVEAWEAPGIIAVQFHPEAFVKNGDTVFLPVFEDLVSRAAGK